MQTILTIIIILEALALIVLAFILIKSKISLGKIMKNAELIVKGKLDVEDIHTVGNKRNTTTVLAGGFNSIKNNLLTFIEATKVNVITLSDAINVLSSSVEANQAGNEQIANGVSAVAEKSAQQLELVERNLELIESSNQQMQEIDDSMSQIKNRLEETVQTTKKGINDINGYTLDIATISEELSRINTILEKFNDEIKQIEEVGDFIIGINDQLMLLAFNASIEAARAGQAGKGFTVVADEMNQMSIETKEGMDTINKIVGEIIESSQQVNESIKSCETTFNQSKETFDCVNDSFQSINKQAYDIHDSMEAISVKTGTIAENSNELKEQANGLYEASQLISEKTHEIAAASEETAAESSQISVNVDALGGMLNGIQGLLKQFNTAVVPTKAPSKKMVKIAVLSMLDNDFWFGVRKGIYYAQKELSDMNVRVDYSPFAPKDGEPSLDEQVATEMRKYIDDKYDGIILPGFMGGAYKYLKEAISKGIKVVAFNCDCPSDIKRLAHFSPNGFEAGELAAKCMERALNKKGNVAIMTGDFSINVNQERRDGFLSKIASCHGIHIVDELSEKDFPELVYKQAVGCLNKHKDLDAIFVTTGMILSVAKAIEDLGLTGRVIVIGYDNNQEIFEYIKKGIIHTTISQDPFGQGHDPIVWMYNHIVTGEKFPKEHMSCRLSIVDGQNVENLIEA